jgi:hypothetical protein
MGEQSLVRAYQKMVYSDEEIVIFTTSWWLKSERFINNQLSIYRMERKIITVEEAVKTIDSIVNKAEKDFFRANARHPSFVNEDDYVLLGQHINILEEYEKKAHVISVEDISLKFITNYLQRQGFLDFAGGDSGKIIDGIFGRVDYNAPPREFQHRIGLLNQLIRKGVSFPPDYQAMVQSMEAINNAAFLHSYEATWEGGPWNPKGKKIPSEKDPAGKKYDQGYRGVGHFFVNPSGMYKMVMELNKSYQDYIKFYKGTAKQKPNPDRNYYK